MACIRESIILSKYVQRQQLNMSNGRKLKWPLLLLLLAMIITFVVTMNSGKPFFTSKKVPLNSHQLSAIKHKNSDHVMAEKDELRIKTQVAVAPVKNEQMSIVPRPSWTLDGTLAAQIDELTTLAQGGDNKASYILAMNLRTCFFVPTNDNVLAERLQQAYQYKDDGLAVATITERYHFCFGVDESQRRQFYRYLEAAAHNGYVPAQEMMANVTPELFLELSGDAHLEREAYIDKRDEFNQQKITLLESASHHGSLKALMRLSDMGYSQNYLPSSLPSYVQSSTQKNAPHHRELGRAQSFAFNQIILELTDDNELYSRYAKYQQNLQTQLTSEEMDQASTTAIAWLKIIRANGTLYLNDN